MLVAHGGVFLQIKTVGEIQQRAKKAVVLATSVALTAFALAGLWITRLEGYHVTSVIEQNGASNPLAKFVKRGEGLWLDNYEHLPVLWGIPLLVFVAGGLTIGLSKKDQAGWAFITSSLMLTGIILTAGVSMFPFLIPSNISLNSSLTIWDASSSHRTLQIMFWATGVFLPLVLLYTRWVFKVLRGKLSVEQIQQQPHSFY
jgi:cytochrome d ubiquinol oxidase subunit II